MRHLLFTIRVWLATLHFERVLKPSLAVYKVRWTPADEQALRDFLQTIHGEKLQSVLLAYVQNTDREAVNISSIRACGYATGQRTLLATLIALSGNIPPQVDEPEAEEPQAIPRYRNPLPESGNEKPAHS